MNQTKINLLEDTFEIHSTLIALGDLQENFLMRQRCLVKVDA